MAVQYSLRNRSAVSHCPLIERACCRSDKPPGIAMIWRQLLPAVPGNASLIVQLPACGDIWLQSGDHRQGERDRWSNAVS